MEKLNLRTETRGNLIIETYHVPDHYSSPDRGVIGVCVDIRVQTRANWAELRLVGAASLWSVEGDAAYIRTVEAEMLEDALGDLELTRAALCDAGR